MTDTVHPETAPDPVHRSLRTVLRQQNKRIEESTLIATDYLDHEWLAANLDILTTERVQAGYAPGCLMALFDQDGIFHEVSAGTFNASAESPTIDTRYRIASCTKSFTAAAILLLRDRGFLTLDDPITRYVPEVNSALPDENVVPTLRMLLSMRGGLVTDDPWADRQESLSSADFRSLLKNQLIYAALPGERFEYSNTGYALLGQVIESLSGTSFCEFVAEEIFKPLGLNDTTFDFNDVPTGNMALGHRRTRDDWQSLPLTFPGAYSAIGGVITTVKDLATWAAWLNDANVPLQVPQADMASPSRHMASVISADSRVRGDVVLGITSRREMQRIQTLISSTYEKEPPQGYGYGLRVHLTQDNDYLVQHSGGYPGYSAHMRWSARMGIGIIAFENATYSGVVAPASEALARVLTEVRRQRAENRTGTEHRLPDELKPLADTLVDSLTQWDVARLEHWCNDNIALDCPFDERQAQWHALKVSAGAFYPAAAVARAVSPQYIAGHEICTAFEIEVPAAQGYLLISALLAPLKPFRLQWFSLKHVSDEEADTSC